MADVIRELKDEKGNFVGYIYLCPGCCIPHVAYIAKPSANGSLWTFSGSQDKPSFSPSFNLQYKVGFEEVHCHHWIKDGRIRFTEQSNHPLAGKEVDLPPIIIKEASPIL